MHDESVKLKRELNSYAPIHKLPPELFSDILELDLRSSYDTHRSTSKRLDRRRQLGSVCSAWRQVFQTTPILWKDISAADADYRLAVKLSGNTPLDIHCVSTDDTRSKQNAGFMRFLDAIVRDANRFRTVQVDVSEMMSAAYLRQCLQDTTATHTALSIHNSSEYTDYSIDLSSSSSMSLQCVILYRTALPWILSGLRILELRSIQLGPTLQQLERMIIASPQLERLMFSHIQEPGHHAPLPPKVITLTRLLSLHLDNIPSRLCRYLVKTIRSHNLRSLQLDILEADVEPEDVLRFASPAFCSHGFIRFAVDSSMWIHNGDGRMHTERAPSFYSFPEDELWIRFNPLDRTQALKTAAHYIGSSKTRGEVHLDVCITTEAHYSSSPIRAARRKFWTCCQIFEASRCHVTYAL